MNRQFSSVLDQDVITSLRELGGTDDPDLFTELVTLFLEDTPQRLDELGEAMSAQDAAGLERSAHSLKSSSANLGAMELSAIFREIERAGRDHDLDRAAALVQQSSEAYQRAEAALKQEIG